MNATTMQRPALAAGRPGCPPWCESPSRGAGHDHYVTTGAVLLDENAPAGADIDLWPSVQVELTHRAGEQPRVHVTGYMGVDVDDQGFDLDQAAELYRALGEALELVRGTDGGAA